MLTEMFGPCGYGWKVEVVNKEMAAGHGNEVRVFVDLNLYIKDGDSWSDPIPGFGGSSFVTAEKNGMNTDDDCYKKAFTDAFGSACKLLGFSEDIYSSSYGSKHEREDQLPRGQKDPADTILPHDGIFMQLGIGGLSIREAYARKPKDLHNILADPNAPKWLADGIRCAAGGRK